MQRVERWQLLRVLTVSSLRSRYRNSVLGLAWGVLEPLSLTLVFVVVFSIMAPGSLYQGATPYPVFVFLGTVLWSLFAQGTMQGGNGVLLRSNLVKKIYFPRAYISLGYVFTILLTTVINLAVFALLVGFYGLGFAWSAIVFPVILGIEILIVLGVSLVLASIFVRLEDLRYLWQLITNVGLFASPVIYQPSLVAPQFAFWYELNPMVGILDAARDSLVNQTWPSASSLAYPAMLGTALLVLGIAVFRRSEHLFAERL